MADDRYETGIAIREAMFGPQHAQAKIDAATDFTRDFEVLVTNYCFGEVWGRDGEDGRPGLDRKTRSMLTLAMLVALGKPIEIRVHTQGAIANGVSKDEIREILLHAAVYAGIPAAVDGFRNATEVLDSLGVE